MSSDSVARNVALWTRLNAEYTDASAADASACRRPAPPDATTHPFYSDIPADWARQWPGEEIWVARRQ